MALCRKCNRKGFFVRVTKDSICNTCDREVRNQYAQFLPSTAKYEKKLENQRIICDQILVELGEIVFSRIEQRDETWEEAVQFAGLRHFDIQETEDLIESGRSSDSDNLTNTLIGAVAKGIQLCYESVASFSNFVGVDCWVGDLEPSYLLLQKRLITFRESEEYFNSNKNEWVRRLQDAALSFAFTEIHQTCLSSEKDTRLVNIFEQLKTINKLCGRANNWSGKIEQLANSNLNPNAIEALKAIQVIIIKLEEIELGIVPVPIDEPLEIWPLFQRDSSNLWAMYRTVCRSIGYQILDCQIDRNHFRDSKKYKKGEFETQEEFVRRATDGVAKEKLKLESDLNEKHQLEQKMSSIEMICLKRIEMEQSIERGLWVRNYDTGLSLLGISFRAKLFGDAYIPVVISLPRDLARELVTEWRQKSKESNNRKELIRLVVVVTITGLDTTFDNKEFEFMTETDRYIDHEKATLLQKRLPWVKFDVKLKEISLEILATGNSYPGRLPSQDEYSSCMPEKKPTRRQTDIDYSVAVEGLLPKAKSSGHNLTGQGDEDSFAAAFLKNERDISRSHGYADFDEYKEAYWNGESDLEMGEPR